MPDPARRGATLAHVGIAVRDLDAILPFYRDILELPDVPVHDMDQSRIVGLAAGEALIELLESPDPASPIGKFVATRGPGIHHICFAVDDLDRALDRCRTAGLRLIDQTPRLGAEGKRIAFIHPSATAGVLVELMER